MNKRELINQQAYNTWQALYVGLENYNIIAGVDYTNIEVHNSVLLLSYTLTMNDTSKWRTLQGLVPELTQMAQLENDSKVRVSFNGLKYRIEVPKPRALHDTVKIQDIFDATNGLGISFGLSAYNNRPNLVDFSGAKAGHMLVSGSTRCGKTNILKLIAMMLMYKNSPENMRLAVIDIMKAKGKYGALTNSAHLAVDLVDTEPKAIAFLTWVKDTIIKLNGQSYDKKVILLIDEVFFLAKNKSIKHLLEYIASVGAESGFHIIAATQYTKVDDLGGKQFKGNLMTRVAGRVDDHYASSNATGKEGVGAENLMFPGDFLVVDHNGVDRIAVPEVKDRFFNRVPKGMSPIAKINWTDEEIGQMPGVIPRAPNIGVCFEKIDPRLLHLAINGSIKGRPLGADKIRDASYILASKGLGERIGQNSAHEYVKFGQLYRASNKR